MAFFDWKEEYTVGIAAIDDQHKKILDLINELFESFRDSREDLIIDEVLDDLLEYANYHFGLEETLFTKYDYQKKAAHIAEHQHFIARISALKIKDTINPKDIPAETFDYLRDWFKNHMLTVDIVYSDFYRQKGVVREIEEACRK